MAPALVECFAFKTSSNGVVCSLDLMALFYPLFLALFSNPVSTARL